MEEQSPANPLLKRVFKITRRPAPSNEYAIKYREAQKELKSPKIVRPQFYNIQCRSGHTKLKVTINTITYEKRDAAQTFAYALSHVAQIVGMQNLVDLRLIQNRYPLFSKSQHKDNKYESGNCKLAICDRWYVKTHSSTQMKANILTSIIKKFDIALTVDVV